MENLDEDQQAVADYIALTYEPAPSPGDADLRISTKELFIKIDKGFPAVFTPDELVSLMNQNKFTFWDNDLEFEWLLKRK